MELEKAEPVSVERLLERKAEMEAELQKGQAVFQRQQADLERTRQTMLAIQGALTLLNELLAEASQDEPRVVKVDQKPPTHTFHLAALPVKARKDGKGDDAEVPADVP